MIKKYLIFAAAILAVSAAIVGCTNKPSDTNETTDSINNEPRNYSIGLDDNGMYVGIDLSKYPSFDFVNKEYDKNEIFTWTYNYYTDLGYEYKDEDDFVKTILQGYLSENNIDNKDTEAVIDDKVQFSYQFMMNGEKIDDYSGKQTITVSKEKDAIVNSVIGKKTGDKYTVEYTFPEDEKDAEGNKSEYAGKSCSVEVEILSVKDGHFFEGDYVTTNLDVIQKSFPDAKDEASLIEIAKILLIKTSLNDYIEAQIKDADMDVPDEYAKYELQRYKYRIADIGISYEEYLKQMNKTEDELLQECKKYVKENIILSKYVIDNNIEITEKTITDTYGEESIDQYKEVQGVGYLYLNCIRNEALKDMASKIKFK